MLHSLLTRSNKTVLIAYSLLKQFSINASKCLAPLLSTHFQSHSLREKAYLGLNLPAPIVAIDRAFEAHYYLKLSPSDFIIFIGQALAHHINQNAEKLRKNFVDHEGQADIIVQRMDISLGGNSDWSTVFEDFSKEIKKRVKNDIYDVVIDDTSGATPITKIVSEITLMNSMKNYFRFVLKGGCGLPKVTLKGTPEDWKKLQAKVEKLQEMNKDDCLQLDWWLTQLVPVVKKICDNAINRNPDRKFWGNIYKQSFEYTLDWVNGWITVFFPYLSGPNGLYPNPSVLSGDNVNFKYKGWNPDHAPKGICEVPFIFKDVITGQEAKLHFYGGHMGGKYNKDDDTLEIAYFWCVAHDKE